MSADAKSCGSPRKGPSPRLVVLLAARLQELYGYGASKALKEAARQLGGG